MPALVLCQETVTGQNTVLPLCKSFVRRQKGMFGFEISRQGQSADGVCFLFIPASRFNGFSQAEKITIKIILLKLII